MLALLNIIRIKLLSFFLDTILGTVLGAVLGTALGTALGIVPGVYLLLSLAFPSQHVVCGS